MSLKLFIGILIFVASSTTYGQSALSYSGRLVNADGSPVSGPVNLRFDLAYTSNSAVILCSRDLSNLSLAQGVFHVKLEFTTAQCGGTPLVEVLRSVAPGDAVAIRVTDLTPVVDKVYGFQALHSMPFALVAEQAKSIGPMGATTAGQVLRWDGTQWAPDTIDEVAAGSIGTPELSDNSVTSAKIVDLTITGADIANGTINESKLNLADGSIAQSKVAGLAASFTGKENALGTATSSEYLAGDRAWRSFQNDVRATFVGMGYAPILAGGAILTTDSLVTAIAKLDGRISNAETAQGDYVSLAGDTMTGPLVLSADPSVALGAATKQYVDTQITAVSAGSSQWDNIAGGINYAGGNVGIGAPTPTNKFEVAGGRTSLSTTFAAPGALVVRGYNGEPATSGTARTDIFRIGQVGGGAALDFGVATTFGRSWIQTHNDVNQSITFDLLLNPLGGNIGVGTSAPAAKLDVAGTIKISGGSPGVGKVLTSDAAGLATWEPLPVAGITGLTGDVTGTGPGATATTIAPGAVTYAKTNFADNDIPQVKVNGLISALAGKEPAIAAGTTAQYYRGDKTWQTLNTTAVPEGTNLYFTEPRVLGTSLAGFTANTSQVDVTSADSTLVAFQKLQSSINAILTGSVPFENNINLGGFRATNLAAPTAAGDATTKAYVDSAIAGVAAGASKWDTVTGGINYDTGSVGIGSVPFSYNGAAALVLKNNKGVVFESNTSVMTNFSVAGDVLSINRCSGTDCTGGSPRLNLGLAGAGYLEIPNAPHLRIGAPTSLGAAGITITSGYGDAVIGMNDNSLARNLTIKASGINSGTDNNGGTLTLTSGASSGTGASKIDFQTATPGASGTTINTTTTKMTITGVGLVGIGTTAPTTRLQVAGSLTIGNGNETCAAGNFAGAIRYVGGAVEFCNGAAWTALASAGGSTPGDNTVTSAKIADGSIVDADVAAGAAIAQSKIANLTTDLSAKQPLDADLTALAGVATNGVLVRTGAGTAVTRSLAGTANRVSVTNADGVAGNPTVDVSATLLPSPLAGDANKFLKASGANTAAWQALVSGDITAALGFTPINKAGDTMPSGVFDFTTSSVVRVLNPVGVTDVANKQYVDGQISGAANQWAQSGGNVFRSTGNVGVGTAAPSEKFVVNNDTGAANILIRGTTALGTTRAELKLERVDNPRGAGMRIMDSGTATGQWWAGVPYNGGSASDMFTIGRHATQPEFNTSSLFTVAATGNVGIGTNVPNAKLEVQAATDPVAIRLTETGGTHAIWEMRAYNTTLGGANNQFSIWGGLSGASLEERLVIEPDGNVGIGTTDPAAKLVVSTGGPSAPYSAATDKLIVNGTGNAVIQVTTPNTTSGGIYFSDPESRDPGGIAYSHLSDSMAFRANGATRLTLTSDGSLGLGTGTPDSYLHARRDFNGLSSVSALHAQGVDGGPVNTDVYLIQKGAVGGYNDFGLINAVSAGTSKFYVRGDGSVGVGTSAPSSHLHVSQNVASGYASFAVQNTAAGGNKWSFLAGSTGSPPRCE